MEMGKGLVMVMEMDKGMEMALWVMVQTATNNIVFMCHVTRHMITMIVSMFLYVGCILL